jgi:hypothetical protein
MTPKAAIADATAETHSGVIVMAENRSYSDCYEELNNN